MSIYRPLLAVGVGSQREIKITSNAFACFLFVERSTDGAGHLMTAGLLSQVFFSPSSSPSASSVAASSEAGGAWAAFQPSAASSNSAFLR